MTGPYDSWEPDVAADPSSSYVYVIDNRFGAPTACARCPDPPLIVQASADGGATWGEPVFVCPCRRAGYQFDPTIYVTNTGVVYAAWLNGHSTVFSQSSDHGQTWSAPIRLNPNRWTDHPWLGASADGRNISVFWAQGDAYEVHSHDFGVTW